MRARWLMGFVMLGTWACSPPVATPDVLDASAVSDSAGDAASEAAMDGAVEAASGLPIRHAWDATQAARGKALLEGGPLGRGIVPRVALRNLWVAWGDVTPGTDASYWQKFRSRYGLYDAPYANNGYPMGIHAVDASTATFDCMLCHGTVTAGRTILGVGNSTLDLQALHDDLVRLNMLAPMYGFPSFPVPFTLMNRTGAAGANDATGLGMEFAIRYDPRMPAHHTEYGYQQAPAWWTQVYRDRQYTDGSGEVGGHRTMMATLLAFGYTFTELQAMDADFQAIGQAILATPSPRWDLTTLDTARVERGRVVYQTNCASCHGTNEGAGASFPDRIVDVATVGTDPVRATQFTNAEASWINSGWFGADHAMRATGGYLAPPLTGVWASAPYFHNGTVPDLRGVIDSTARPARWQRTGTTLADYDLARVGWKYTEPSAPATRATVESRRVVDTAQRGMSNAGHTYGDALSTSERDDLLEDRRSL